tara:strand:- start:769 stop:1353 length:585 start_codon:yes stop_codon:yes gene_type:complete
MAKTNPNKCKIPPIIINHNESGQIICGVEDKDVTRKRDIGLYASKADSRLRLFRDGGFELHSSKDENDDNFSMGSEIIQNCDNAPLHIISMGDIRVSCAGTFSVDANRIVLKSNASNETGINIDAESDIRIQAGRDYLVTAENITHDAKERVLSHSEGWTILIGQCIRLHEPQTKICPAFMREYIDGQIKTLKG